ncbi:class I SAM-dependent methyltransferase [Roseomonas sp. F4]
MFRDVTGASAREARGWLLMRESRIKALEELVRLREMTVKNAEAATREIEDDYAIKLEQREDTVRDREARIRDLEDRVVILERRTRELYAGMPQVEVDFDGFSKAAPQDRALMAWQAADGWCSREKALWLAHLAESRRVTRALEIGVYGGKSLLPIAAVISAWDGVTFGVEPWSRDVAVAEPTTGTNDDYWSRLDFDLVKARFHVAGLRLGLMPHIRMLEIPSDQARLALAGQGFDLIHLDGSHAPGQALRDIIGWSALLSESGVLVVDDIDWPSLAEGRAYLARNFLVLDEVREADGVSYGAYLLRHRPA